MQRRALSPPSPSHSDANDSSSDVLTSALLKNKQASLFYNPFDAERQEEEQKRKAEKRKREEEEEVIQKAAAAAAVVYPGVTPPLDVTVASDAHQAQTEAMIQYLNAQCIYESGDQLRLRERTLGELHIVVQQWARECMNDVEEPTSGSESDLRPHARIFTYGSYRLGVHTVGADIDVLVATSRFLNRDLFFDKLSTLLRAVPGVRDVVPVRDAFVPVLKLMWGTVEMDLVYAQLDAAFVPPSLTNDSVLRNMDEASVRSINGVRVTDAFTTLVHDPVVFRDALRCIKYWARQRGIYGNAAGYLGGVSWAILVARVCQLYPNKSASHVVDRFFFIMEEWKWPSPVMLNRPSTSEEARLLRLRQWDPASCYSDRAHLMPILTPAFPRQNSTYNVMASSLQVLRQEIFRSRGILMRRLKSPPTDTARWAELCAPVPFRTLFSHYIRVEILSTDETHHAAWKGWSESRLRLLVQALESVPLISGVRLFPDSEPPPTVVSEGTAPAPSESSVPPVSSASWPCRTAYLAGLKVEKQPPAATKRQIDLSTPVLAWRTQVCGHPQVYVPEHTAVTVTILTRSQLNLKQ